MIYKLVSLWGPQFRSPRWQVPMSLCAFRLKSPPGQKNMHTHTHTHTQSAQVTIWNKDMSGNQMWFWLRLQLHKNLCKFILRWTKK